MYLRPGNLLQDFMIECRKTKSLYAGHSNYDYEQQGTLKAVLAQAKPTEIERFKQLSHPITHTLTQRGKPKAKRMDRLVLGTRHFYIQGVDEVGGLGICTIYYAEERCDVIGNQYPGGN